MSSTNPSSTGCPREQAASNGVWSAGNVLGGVNVATVEALSATRYLSDFLNLLNALPPQLQSQLAIIRDLNARTLSVNA